MNAELLFQLRSLTRFVYYVTEEEDRFIVGLADVLKKHAKRTFVFNSAHGNMPIEQYIKDWSTKALVENDACRDIHATLAAIYKDNPMDETSFYIITDPERWFQDPQAVRRTLNIVHQMHNDIRTVKIVIFVGARKFIPEKLSRYIEVVQDRGLTEEEITKQVEDACTHLQIPVPANPGKMFRGLISYEIDSCIAQSIIKTKKDPTNPKRIDEAFVADFKKRQLLKTDLVQYVDVSKVNFDQVGGIHRFKEWARKTKASWTDKGQAFGLRPPKGVLLVGVWGCGKSLASKAMGAAWGLPVVQLEMGKLRSSAVGESEANIYRAIRLIEASSPCLVWIDEAEKSLNGGQSSGMTDAGIMSRSIGILSTWLQETTAPVCLCMTANSLGTLPVEFINRMDERFFFDLPSEEDRIDILKIHLAKVGQDPAKYDLASLAEAARNMVGREIEQAILAAMTESFDAKKPCLDEGILTTALTRKPRIVRTMADEIKSTLDWVGYDPDVDDGIRARFASNRAKDTVVVASDA